MSADLAVIEAALEAATPGPWETWPHTHVEDGCRCFSCQFVTVWQTRNGLGCDDIPRKPGESERCDASGYSWEDATLIANAPTWLAELVERVKVAEARASGDVKFRADVIDALLDALGITDDTTEDDTRRILGGCDCNGEEGTLHLIWHLKQAVEHAEAAVERVRALLGDDSRRFIRVGEVSDAIEGREKAGDWCDSMCEVCRCCPHEWATNCHCPDPDCGCLLVCQCALCVDGAA